MKALTKNEIEKLLDSTSGEFRTMILLAYRHGLRVSELCLLLKADVHLSEGTITIRRLKKSLTTVQPLGTEEQTLLTQVRHVDTDSPYVFAARLRSRKYFWAQFKQACLSVGISADKAHPHALRHGLGYALAKANVTLPVIQRALGHRNMANTAIYTELDDESVGKIVQEALR